MIMIKFLQDTAEGGGAARPRTTRNSYLKRLALGLLMSAAICVVPALQSGVKATGTAVSEVCGTPNVFAFPNTKVPQGTPVTIFVTESNQTAKANPFVVGTTIVAPNGTSVVATDTRIVQLAAEGGSTSYAISFTTNGSTTPGTYTVTAESYQGGVLPAVTADFCSSTVTTFTILCNGNDCSGTVD
jgi:hypothetical protein